MSRALSRFRPAVGAALVKVWNTQWPKGTPVTVVKDLGDLFETYTRSEAWCLGDGSPVVMVDGISGGYALERMIPRLMGIEERV